MENEKENSSQRYIKFLENEKEQTRKVLLKIETQLAKARLAIKKERI